MRGWVCGWVGVGKCVGGTMSVGGWVGVGKCVGGTMSGCSPSMTSLVCH